MSRRPLVDIHYTCTSLRASLEIWVILMKTMEMIRVLLCTKRRAVSPNALTPGSLVQHQEHQQMKEEGVEEGNGPSCLAGQYYTP